MTLADRAASSRWVADADGLAESVAAWAADIDEVDRRAARLTRSALPPPARAVRYAAALEAGRLRWLAASLPSAGLRPLRDPAGWAKDGVVRTVRHQLELLGASGAEIARIIDSSEGLLPAALVEEIRDHPVRVAPFPAATAARVASLALEGRISDLSAEPFAATPVSQVHAARLDDERQVLVRVRRPGAARDLAADAWLSAVIARAAEQLIPAARRLHPLGFVDLAARQAVEELDMRREALNAVELALALEDLGVEGVTVARPIAGLATERVVVSEDLPGARPLASADARIDRDVAVAAYIGTTIEAALACGIFHADLRPEHLFVLPDGSLAIVGCGVVGRFDLPIRRAAFAFLTALFSGDHAGQVAAMRQTGAVPDDVDEDRLVADLAAAPSLSPTSLLAGGGNAIALALADAVRILLRHRLRPPTEVVLFVRNVFALRSFLELVAPDTSPFTALLPLVQRLPELNARLAAATP